MSKAKDPYSEGFHAGRERASDMEFRMRCVEQANKLIPVDSADTIVAAARAFYKFVKAEK